MVLWVIYNFSGFLLAIWMQSAFLRSLEDAAALLASLASLEEAATLLASFDEFRLKTPHPFKNLRPLNPESATIYRTPTSVLAYEVPKSRPASKCQVSKTDHAVFFLNP